MVETAEDEEVAAPLLRCITRSLSRVRLKSQSLVGS